MTTFITILVIIVIVLLIIKIYLDRNAIRYIDILIKIEQENYEINQKMLREIIKQQKEKERLHGSISE